MAIAEKLNGIHFAQRILSKVNENPCLNKINSKEIFVSSDGFALTSFGMKVQRVLINASELKSLQPYQARLKEVLSEIKTTCQEIGIDANKLKNVNGQFGRLVKMRDLKIDLKYAGEGTIFHRLKRKIILAVIDKKY
jgi:hypothetical protein